MAARMFSCGSGQNLKSVKFKNLEYFHGDKPPLLERANSRLMSSYDILQEKDLGARVSATEFRVFETLLFLRM